MTVTYDIDTINAALSNWEHDSVWFLVSGAAHADFTEFRQAVLDADERAIERGEDGHVFGDVAGPYLDALAVYISQSGVAEPLGRWLADFTRGLERRGVSGHLTPSWPTYPPDWVRKGASALTSFMTLRSDPAMTGHPWVDESAWRCTEETTSRVVEQIQAWARRPGAASTLLGTGSYMTSIGPDDESRVVEPLTAAAMTMGTAQLVLLDERAGTGTLAAFSSGDVIVQEIDARRWRPDFDRLRLTLISLAPDLVSGYLRPARPHPTNIHNMASAMKPPHVDSRSLRYHRHLLDRYVPDAHGIQLLTGRHLDGIHNLASWTVTDLGGDRFLVEAADTTPWYAAPLPDPEVLAQARIGLQGDPPRPGGSS